MTNKSSPKTEKLNPTLALAKVAADLNASLEARKTAEAQQSRADQKPLPAYLAAAI